MPRHHHLDYVEFSVTDLAASKDFFVSVFGWDFTDYSPGYSGFSRDGLREAGGLRLVDAPVPSHDLQPLVILWSDDLEGTLESVQSAGGAVTVPIFAFPGGRRFHFREPSGNPLAVWST